MVDRASWRPAWQQVANALRAEILSGALPPGSPLPTEGALSERFDVSRTTIRASLDALRSEGHLITTRGRGSFVRKQIRLRRQTTELTERGAQFRGWYAALEREGLASEVRTSIGRWPCPPAVAEHLGVEAAAPVLVRARVMGVAGEPPMHLADSHIPLWVADRVPALQAPDTGPGGMLSRLEDAGFRLWFEEVISSRAPTPAESSRMQLAPGVPVLHVVRLTCDQERRVLDCMVRVLDAGRGELAYRFGDQPA